MRFLFVRGHDSRVLDVNMLAKITAGLSNDEYFVTGVIDDDPANLRPYFLGSICIDDNNATFFARDGRVITWNHNSQGNAR